MDVADVRTVRSFCRICTSVCGILVDVAGDEVGPGPRRPGPPALARLHVCEGTRAPADAPPPGPHRTPDVRVDGALQPTTWEAVPRRPRGPELRAGHRGTTDRPRSASSSAAAIGMDAAGYRMAQASPRRHRHAGEVQPAHDRRHREGAGLRSGRRLRSALNARPTTTTPRSSCTSGCNPVVSHGHTVAMPDPVVGDPCACEPRAEVWVLDPRRTETARLADRHLAPRPGTDYAVLAYLVREAAARRCRSYVLERVHGRRRRAGRGGRAVHARARGAGRRRRRTRPARSCSPRSAAPGASPSTPGPASRWRRAQTSPSGWRGR